MIELTSRNAARYLADRVGDGPWKVRTLGGGVSNTVLLAEAPNLRLVLKQALGKLRVKQDWFSDRRRVLRESRALTVVEPWLPGAVPELIFEDHENLIIAMFAAPKRSQPWKSLLLKGDIKLKTARRVGEMLAAMVRNSWLKPALEAEFGDQTVFDELRLDPYYRSTAERHPDLRGQFEALIEESGARRVSLVHGDWSPKNFLVFWDAVYAIDFEVIHYGDPAFDSAFLLNHLALKSFYQPQWQSRYEQAAAGFWSAYQTGLPDGAEWMEGATVRHLGCLMLARVDGKSPVEYLKTQKERAPVREFARELIRRPPERVMEVFRRLRERCEKNN